MNKTRVEIFSDGILAIIITIMVLELKAPENTELSSLIPVIPVFLSYVLSFIYLAIYWMNHHLLFQATEKVSTAVLWANMHLLFWLSLIPFTTSWMGENHLEPVPVAIYGGVLFMSAVAFRMLEVTLIKTHNKTAPITQHISRGHKEIASIVLYLTGILMSFVHIAVPVVCYVLVALLWIIPSRKLENSILQKE